LQPSDSLRFESDLPVEAQAKAAHEVLRAISVAGDATDIDGDTIFIRNGRSELLPQAGRQIVRRTNRHDFQHRSRAGDVKHSVGDFVNSPVTAGGSDKWKSPLCGGLSQFARMAPILRRPEFCFASPTLHESLQPPCRATTPCRWVEDHAAVNGLSAHETASNAEATLG
jgi:hypothetical protein